MLKYINYRMRITLSDSRVVVGKFMAFDKHMNMVLGESEEFRRIKAKKGAGVSLDKEERRALGLIILRGDSIVSMTIEGPPPPEDVIQATPGGPGTSIGAGRGANPGVQAPGLAGPVHGIGGPAPGMMVPPPMHMGGMGMGMGMGMAPGMGMGMGMPGAPGIGMPPGQWPPGYGMPPPGMAMHPGPGMGGPPPGPGLPRPPH